MVEIGNSEAFHALARAEQEFISAYKDTRVGDPRLMAIWDLSDSVDAEASVARIYQRKDTGEEFHTRRLTRAIMRSEIVINRIDMRATEVPGYALAMREANNHLDKLTIVRASAYDASSLDHREWCAARIGYYAQELTQKIL